MITERLRAKAYEPQFDQRIGLKASYISRQIDTFLGERLNVLLSKNKYEIRNGLIYGQDMDEPFIEVMKRGVDYRQKAEGGNRVDKRREEAEVEGFLKTQEILSNPQTPVGTTMLSISAKGGKDSLYQHNFYDIFTLKAVEGRRFIEARRYSSALSIEEYRDKLSSLSSVESISDDVDFLKSPIEIDNVFFENAGQIHSYLHKDHKFMELEEFERIIKTCSKLKDEYVRIKDPRILNAIMNKADEGAGIIEIKPDKFYDYLAGSSQLLTTNREVDFYGRQPVRSTATGCGSSGSVSEFDKKSGLLSPFSVLSFGLSDEDIDYEFDQDGPCKKCNTIAVKCGPCGICKACDLTIRTSQRFSLN
ncbi:MAG: hypothetical protein Q8P29_04015 [Candidatus Levybacteria bacterium]|nr:hypothetical protein [Candidatus Levybacteria bacterium]